MSTITYIQKLRLAAWLLKGWLALQAIRGLELLRLRRRENDRLPEHLKWRGEE